MFYLKSHHLNYPSILVFMIHCFNKWYQRAFDFWESGVCVILDKLSDSNKWVNKHKLLSETQMRAMVGNRYFPANLPILDGKNLNRWCIQMCVIFNVQDMSELVDDGFELLVNELLTKNRRKRICYSYTKALMQRCSKKL